MLDVGEVVGGVLKDRVVNGVSMASAAVHDFVQNVHQQYTISGASKRVLLSNVTSRATPHGPLKFDLFSTAPLPDTTAAAAGELQPGIFYRTLRLELPTPLVPSHWQRHGLSLRDIVDTIRAYKAHHLWHLALLLQLPIATTAVRVTHEGPDGLIYSGKQPAYKQIVGYVTRCAERGFDYLGVPILGGGGGGGSSVERVSMLTHRQCEHRPQLPVHRVPAALWHEYHAEWQHKTMYTELVHQYRRDFEWPAAAGSTAAAIRVVPFRVVQRAAPNKASPLLELLRIVPQAFYFEHCQRPQCLTQDPLRIQVGGMAAVGTLESFYVVADEAPPPP